MEFYIGQVFEGEYPPEAAVWCNEGNGIIEEIETVDGVRRFQIMELPPPPETKTVRIFSKYKLCDATIDMPFTLADGTETTVWQAFKSFITAAGKKDLWDNIIEVAEDNKHFQEAIPVAVANFGEELVEQVLAASVERVETRVIE